MPEVMPGPDTPARVDVPHESGRTRVSRLFLPARTVIRREPLGHDARRRLQREVWMLQRLRGVTGVAQLVDARGIPRPSFVRTLDIFVTEAEAALA